MPDLLRYTPLLSTGEFHIGRFDHPAGCHYHDPALEIAEQYSISRVERGGFGIQVGGERWDLQPGDVFLSYPGMEYRTRHYDAVPSDVCLSLACAGSVRDSAEGDAFHRLAEARPVFRPTNRVAYLFLRLSCASVPMAADELAHCLLAEVSDSSLPLPHLFRERQLRWYSERIDAVRSQIDRHCDGAYTLVRLARSVGMSQFHFARVFRELVGVPPHAYLRRTRLQHAARRLREGDSVTEACFASGFQNLSHFTRQFQRHYGVKPSTYGRQSLH